MRIASAAAVLAILSASIQAVAAAKGEVITTTLTDASGATKVTRCRARPTGLPAPKPTDKEKEKETKTVFITSTITATGDGGPTGKPAKPSKTEEPPKPTDKPEEKPPKEEPPKEEPPKEEPPKEEPPKEEPPKEEPPKEEPPKEEPPKEEPPKEEPQGPKDDGEEVPGAPGLTAAKAMETVNKYRRDAGIPEMSWDKQLGDNAHETSKRTNGDKLEHVLLPGSMGQVMVFGGISYEECGIDVLDLSSFGLAFYSWVCEVPDSPGLGKERCQQIYDASNINAEGQTGHYDILSNKDYSKIGCGFFAKPGGDKCDKFLGVWTCDVA